MRIIYKLLFLLVGCLSLSAQTSLSLTDAISVALENNYDIRIIQSKERIAEIQNSWGGAGMYPYVGATLNNDNYLENNETNDFFRSSFGAGANVNWTLFNGFSVRIRKQRLEEFEILSKQNSSLVIEGTVQSVIVAYYNVLLQEQKKNLYEEIMTLSKDRYSRAIDKKNYGAAVTYEVLQAKNAFLSDKSSFLLQEVSVKNALRDLKYVMAYMDEEDFTLNDSLIGLPQSYELEDLSEMMVENNKTLQNQYLNQRLMDNALRAAKNAYLPSIDFRGGASVKRQRTDLELTGVNWANSASMYGNITLSLDIFSGGSKNRAKQIAKIDAEIGDMEIEDMELDLTNRLENILELYKVRTELLDVAEENLEAAALNLKISKEKFESGAINSFNYRDVQIIYLNASQQKFDAVYSFIDTHTTLLRLSGVIVQEY